jgi:hypothetical protein
MFGFGKKDTNVSKVEKYVKKNPSSTDFEIMRGAKVYPRSQVNEIARQLEAQGKNRRVKYPGSPIVNQPKRKGWFR